MEAANDTMPQDELVLAKLIQTANAWGLKSCRNTFFKSGHSPLKTPLVNSGNAVTLAKKATSCCAMGANYLDPEHPAEGWLTWLSHGNDGREKSYSVTNDGYDIGAAFYEAGRGR